MLRNDDTLLQPMAQVAHAPERSLPRAVPRLAPEAVRRVAVCLDEEVAEAFARLTRVAAAMTAAPVALVSLVDGETLHFRGHLGLPEPFASLRTAPLANSFCEHILETGQPLVVHDARESVVHRQKPAFQRLGVVAYLGVPLTTPGGVVLGTMCLIDRTARRWMREELERLLDAAAGVLVEIELRAALTAVHGGRGRPVPAPPPTLPALTVSAPPAAATAPATIDALFDRHAPAVYGLLLTLADRETAGQLLMDTFDRAWQRMAQNGRTGVPLETPEATVAWLRRLALGQAQRAGLFALR